MRVYSFPWRTIKTRATLSTLGIFVASIWVLSFVSSQLLAEDMQRLLGEQQYSTVSIAAASVNDNFSDRMQALQASANTLSSLRALTPLALQEKMEQLTELQHLFNGGFWLAGSDGVAIASVPRNSGRAGIDYMGRGFMIAALRQGRASISDPYLSAVRGVPVFAMAYPVRDAQGTVVGCLVGVTVLGLPNFLDKITQAQYGQSGGYLLVAPASRVIVTATDKSRILERLPHPGVNRFVDRNVGGYEGYSILVNARGEEQLASVKQLPAAGWYLLLGTPTQAALEPIRTMRQRLVLATVVLTLLAGLSSWWILKRQLAPLLKTAEAMVSLSNSSHIPAPLPVHGDDEIGQLTRGFNRLVETWAERERVLVRGQEQLKRVAHFDALTNLPNRVLLADRMQQAMAQAQRRKRQLAAVYLDLDGFKEINDRFGHDAGDQVLVTLALRMKQVLREGDTLARMGGDEFVAVLIDLESQASSVPLLLRLLDAAARPVTVGEYTAKVSTSLGVSFYPQAQDIDADQLLRQSDQAMYQAKLAGKNRYHLFDAEQDSSIRGHHESLERIRLALENGEFVLHYQPKVNMRSGAVVGAEALIRWQHPENGLLPPGKFLPEIEDHVLAVAVGEWVIKQALDQMVAWQALGLHLPVSVNVGSMQLQHADFVPRLQDMLRAHPQVPRGHLSLEVLETSALADIAQVAQVIEACKHLGVTFALDDFGTGYSSLTYLKRLRVQLLKIDQSFVRDMLQDADDLAILQGVIGLAAAFAREVIAEGVETVEHGSKLLQLGCDLAQGYGIARPMPAQQLPAWIAHWQPPSAWAMAGQQAAHNA